MLNLPEELEVEIFSYLIGNDEDKIILRQVSKSFSLRVPALKGTSVYLGRFLDRLPRAKWAKENNCPWTSQAFCLSVKSGSIEVLEWMKVEGCPWDWRAFSYAARYNHLDVLKWLRANGCPCRTWACAAAARENHLEVLQWLRANGYPWDEHTCENAAEGGHLEVLKWARANGCSWWRVKIAVIATKYGYLDLLAWVMATR